jgi:quinoprotein glucose dehydrogenase
MKRIAYGLLLIFFANVIFPDNTWPTFYGDLKAQKYSPLTQITPTNVKQLQIAWVAHTGDVADGNGKLPPTVWSATPLFVNNTVYVGTPFYRIFALDPATGKTKWIFDPHTSLKATTQPALKTRGVAYWQAAHIIPGKACEKRVYVGTMNARLYAVDADTGKLCQDFAKHGVLNINHWNNDKKAWPLSLLQPPTVYKNLLILGWAGKDWALERTPEGNVLAINARTGKLVWSYSPIPKAIAKKTGTANVWMGMSIDATKGIVYLPVSSPSPNFWGGNRLAPIPQATSVTALNANTGKLLWSRQLVHHDLWDYDTNAAPTLVDINKEGKTIPALVQTSKQGFIYVLNRYTGQPIYPIVEKPVPASTAKGEMAAKTQPFVALPKATVPDTMPGIFSLANITSLGYCERQLHKLRYDGRFTPPSEQGSLVYPGTVGGVEWGGGAVDPHSHIFVVNSSSVIQIMKLIPRAIYNKMTEKSGGVEGSDSVYPQTGAPYAIQLQPFLTPMGMPCWKPPYGTIAAYDLDTGKQLWQEPFGQIQKWGFYMPKSWGSITIGAPVITASGLIFIGASMDSRVRALDMKTGKVLWQANVAAPAVSIPAVYQYHGKQYVVFVAGGNNILTPRVSDQVIAFALPNKSTK